MRLPAPHLRRVAPSDTERTPSARPTVAHTPHRDDSPPWRAIILAYLVVGTCFYELITAIMSDPIVERHGVRCEWAACVEAAGKAVAR